MLLISFGSGTTPAESAKMVMVKLPASLACAFQAV